MVLDDREEEIRMQALIQDRYGGADVLELADVPVPAIHDGEVLVQVRAASLNAADVEYLRGDTIVRIAGPRRPPTPHPGIRCGRCHRRDRAERRRSRTRRRGLRRSLRKRIRRLRAVRGRYPLAEAPEAFRRLAAGEIRGKAVIVIG